MTRLTTSFILVMLLAGSAFGAAGDLTFMKKPTAVSPGVVYVNRFTHSGVDKTRGLVNKHSIVGVAPKISGGIHVAIDSAKPDSPVPDVIRLDFSGKGTFIDAPTVALKMRAKNRGVVGPAIVVIKRGGRSIPVNVQGSYWKQNESRGLSLVLASALEGTCKFGAKTYPVYVFDGNANMEFTDVLKPPYNPRSRMPFDRLYVADKKDSPDAARSYLGQPIFVGGKWYNVEISGMKISATPLKSGGGSVRVDAPEWNCILIGKKYYFSLRGRKEPIAVPADEYRTYRYTVYNKGDLGKRCARIIGYGNYPGGKAITVASGKTVELALGAPIEAMVVAVNRGGKVRMNLKMTDALGGRIAIITTDEGKRPPVPSIEVVDKSGEIVYTAKLKYG